jgi:hypothetical protein
LLALRDAEISVGPKAIDAWCDQRFDEAGRSLRLLLAAAVTQVTAADHERLTEPRDACRERPAQAAITRLEEQGSNIYPGTARPSAGARPENQVI